MLSTVILIFELITLMFANLFNIVIFEEIVQIPYIIIYTGFLSLDILKSKKYNNYKIELCLGILLRIATLFFDVYGKNIYILPGSGNDSEMFYYESINFITGTNYRTGTFISMMGTVFKIIGTERLYSQFLLTLFSVVAMFYAIKSLEICDLSNKAKHIALSCLAFLPNYIILSSIFLRESVIVMILSISLYYYLKWFYNKKEFYFIISFLLVFASSTFHSGTVGVAIGYVLCRLLYDKKTNKYSLKFKNIFPSILLLLLLIFLYNNYGDIFFSRIYGVTSINNIASIDTVGGSSYAKYVGNSDTVDNLIIYTIPRFFYFLFSPFIWQWRGLSDIIATIFSSFFYIITIILMIKNFKNAFTKNNVLLSLIIIALCLTFVFAWGTSNTGTAIRHRDKMVVIYSLLLALSY